MTLKKRRREERTSTAKRRAEQHKSGAFERTSIRVPDGVTMFKLTSAGSKVISVIGYEAGKGNPFASPGEFHFERTYYVHSRIGPNQDSYSCPRMNSKQRCPVCEHRARLMQESDHDKDLVKALKPQERQLFNVYDHSEPDKGVQLWDVAHFYFGKALDLEVKNGDEEDGYEFFYFQKGLKIRCSVEENTYGGRTSYKVGSVTFKAREPLDDEIMEAAMNLDEIPVILPYDKLKAIFLQEEEEEEADEDDEPPRKKKKRPPVEDDEDEDEDEDEDDEPPPKKKKRPPVDEDDEPPRKKKTQAKKRFADDYDEDDDTPF